MKSTACLWAMLSLFAGLARADATREAMPKEPPVPVVAGESVILTSSGTTSGLAARETAGPDTFALYGGPDQPTEGKFELADGFTPDWGGGNGLPGGYGGGFGAWTPVDLTDKPAYWHRSQFNAQTLGTSQPVPNHALWCGLDAGDPRADGWVSAPGYGNNWRDQMVYRSAPLADPTQGQVVSLDFRFHHDLEPEYDYFVVEYDSAGTWIPVLSIDGSDKDGSGAFPSPGVQFAAVQTGAIDFAGNDYGGPDRDQIVIRMVVESDGVWSDEDGLYPSDGGAVQIDEISLTTSEGTFTEDFETIPALPNGYLFVPQKAPFVGDFAEVYARITDIDPCRENVTPLAGFVDTGQIIRNGPGADGSVRIPGGSTSPGINYGVPGNYVVNYTGGLSLGEAAIDNEIWSPDIYWDLPGPEDDSADLSGAFFRFTTWLDLPLINGMFYVWHVSSAAAGEPYGNWEDYRFVYFADGVAGWYNYRFDVTELLVQGPERVRIALGVLDYAEVFGFPGNAATPAPFFDNVALYKYRIGGPAITARDIELAQDGFPVNGSIDVSSAATRDALDIPFDMARDVNSGHLMNIAGDSLVVDVESRIPGTSVADVRMVWALRTSVHFEDALRSPPSRAKDRNVVAGAAGTIWTGEVLADSSKTPAGTWIQGRWFLDLPDVDFLYPGDVLHYFFRAADSDGRVSTLPADTTGFFDFSHHALYDRVFTVRGLPGLTASGQPLILVWNDFGHRGGEEEWLAAFHDMGLYEGEDFDTYTTKGPSSAVSNGLGSAGVHGANADQLAGYEDIFYFAGNLSTSLLSDGSDIGGNDKSDDIGLLEQWHQLPGERNVAYFGDNIASALVRGSQAALVYLENWMGVDFVDQDVKDVIGGQITPLVVRDPSGPFAGYFLTDFVAFGGCPVINRFDQILPMAGASAGHLFTDVAGIPIYPGNNGGVASVINPTPNGHDVTVPIGFSSIYTPPTRAVDGSARAWLLSEILGLFDYPFVYCVAHPWCNDAPPQVMAAKLSVTPNPFNPQTTVKFTAASGAKGSVKVFNLRGELVATLHDGEFTAQQFTWEGTDSRGASVASGVYVVRATDGKVTEVRKVAMVK